MPNDQLPSVEKRAMLLDRRAVLEVVSALRRYRQAAHKLWDSRYSDGSVDGARTSSFYAEVDEIEQALRDDEPDGT